MTAPAPAPVPLPPSTWTPTTIAAYVGAFVLFLLASLTQAGVTVPAGVSTEVQLVVGIVGQVAGAVTALLATLSSHSVVKAASKVGR